jgi:hypothetical protein
LSWGRSAGRRAKVLIGRVRRELFSVRDARGPLEELKSLTDIPNLVTLYAVRVAVTLGVADLIEGGTTDVGEIARDVGADADALSRVLRHLVAVGILTHAGPGRVELSHTGALLVKGHPTRFNEILQLHSVSQRFEAAIAEMLHSVVTGEPSYARANGGAFWDQLAEEPQMALSFDIDMQQHIGSMGPELADAFDWSTASEVVDIGGGTGALLSHLLEKHHHLKGSLVEYADAATRATEVLATSGAGRRITVREGSFFDPLPPGADVYILSWILHDWPDQAVKAILKRCHEAAGNDGRVLVVERPLDPAHLSNSTPGDLKMMVFVGGRERTLVEYADLFAAANLRIDGTIPLTGGFMVFIAKDQGSPAASL